jgi:5-methylcytosine-specific restriction endonuclease McrA
MHRRASIRRSRAKPERRKVLRWRPKSEGLAFWTKRRLECLHRDRFRCRRCPAHATDAAHVVPLGMGGSRYDPSDPRNRLSNLVSLCRGCHTLLELGTWRWEEIGLRPSPALLRRYPRAA